MIDEIQILVADYQRWLHDRTAVRAVADDWIEITTPFLDRHNDYLQIYARRAEGGFVLTDDGYTISDLEMSGCGLDTPKRQGLLHEALNGFGVREDQGRLEVTATSETFAPRKHSLIQAMLAVGDMFYMASPVVESLFLEDVMAWFDERDIRYTRGVKIAGRSGFDHVFDFVIPKSRRAPERIVQAINRPSNQSIKSVAFAWMDIQPVRPAQAQAYALLNDAERAVRDVGTEALRNYSITPVFWSQRDEAATLLAS